MTELKASLRPLWAVIGAYVGLSLGIAANSYVCLIWLAFAHRTPFGGAVRPMGETFSMFVIAFIAFTFGVPCSWYCLARKGPTMLGRIGLVLCLTPLPLGLTLVNVIVDSLDLFVKP